jgi:hypothetical protein
VSKGVVMGLTGDNVFVGQDAGVQGGNQTDNTGDGSGRPGKQKQPEGEISISNQDKPSFSKIVLRPAAVS